MQEGDRRSDVRVRHRQAILTAAVELIRDSDGTRFSADELAERAGVSRRTVFNHFASLDEVLIGVCTETLRAATEQLRTEADAAAAGGTPEEMFAALASALRRADLADPIVRIWRALSAVGTDTQQTQAFAQQALAVVAADLSEQLRTHNPHADEVEVDLLASLLTHGIGVIAGHWIESARPGRPPSRAEWDRLLDRLLDALGSGYLPRTPRRSDPPT